MLQLIRDKSQGIIAWVIVGVICITFALWGIHSYLYGNQSRQVIVTINGQEVSRQQFLTFYQHQKRSQPSSKYSAEQLKQLTLDSLISSIVLIQSATKNGFRVAPALIEQTIARIPAFQEKGIFSKTLFERLLRQTSLSIHDFITQMSNDILTYQVQAGIVHSAFALPMETERLSDLINEQRKFSFIQLSPKLFISHIKLPDSAVSEYYRTHSKEFEIPEKISIEYLYLSVADLMKTFHPSVQELQTFYHDLSIKPGETIPFQTVKQELLKQYLHKLAEEKFLVLSDELVNLAYENSNSLEPVAKQIGIPTRYSPLFTREGTKEGFTSVPSVVSAAFEEEVLHQRMNSEPINLGDDQLIVLRIHSHVPAVIKPLFSVQASITEKLKQEAAIQEVKKLGDKILSALHAGEMRTVQSLLKSYGLNWQAVDFVHRYEPKRDQAMLNLVFETATYRGMLLPSKNYLLIALHAIKPGNVKALPLEQQRIYQKEIESTFGLTDYQGYVVGILKNAKIKKEKLSEVDE